MSTLLTRCREAQQRAEAATKGPWRCDTTQPDDVVIWSGPRGDGANLVANMGECITQVGVVCDADAPDGAFIAAAREDVPDFAAALGRALGPEMRERVVALLLTQPGSNHGPGTVGRLRVEQLADDIMAAIEKAAEGSP